MTSERQSTDLNINALVEKCARFIICREGTKTPIKKDDIKKHLGVSQNIGSIIEKAGQILKQVYGYKLVEVSKKGSYIVILDKECMTHDSCYDPYHRQLLNVTLTHIFMSRQGLSESEIAKFLTNAQLIKEDDHEWKKIFKKFVKQLYLETTKNDNDTLIYSWGERAELEIPKMFIINKLAEALHTNPIQWGEQYRIAREEAPKQLQTQMSQIAISQDY